MGQPKFTLWFAAGKLIVLHDFLVTIVVTGF